MRRTNNMNIIATMSIVALIIMSSTTSVIAQSPVTCPSALLQLLPCLTYLTKQAPSPSPQCCSNVKQLNDEANTTPIRQQVCNCIKSAALSYHVDPAVAKGLPELCHVSVPVPVDPKIDCSKDFSVEDVDEVGHEAMVS
ncbi:Non-specific lipid-transfer protein [Linum perenne]